MREVQLRELLGVKVTDSEGRYIGRLEEIDLERGKQFCLVNFYIVEHRGLLDRLSSWTLTASLQAKLEKRGSRPYRVAWNQMDLSDPRHQRKLVPGELLERF
jgi:sporulation protein YlmC with PRC-barrel domain